MESSRKRLLIGGLATLLAAQCLYGILTLATLYKSYKTSLVSVQAIASEKFSLDLSRLARFGKDPERVEDMAVFAKSRASAALPYWTEKGGASPPGPPTHRRPRPSLRTRTSSKRCTAK